MRILHVLLKVLSFIHKSLLVSKSWQTNCTTQCAVFLIFDWWFQVPLEQAWAVFSRNEPDGSHKGWLPQPQPLGKLPAWGHLASRNPKPRLQSERMRVILHEIWQMQYACLLRASHQNHRLHCTRCFPLRTDAINGKECRIHTST